MNKEQINTTAGEWAYKAIANHYKQSIKYENKVLKDRDTEYLHQMRVGMRRLRSTIASFAFIVDLPSEINPKSVGKIAKVLGNLRDIDVIIETLTNQYQPYISKEESKNLKSVFKKLQKNRKSAFKQVKKTLKSKKYTKIKNSCQSWIDKPLYQPIADINIEQILPDLLLPQISYFLLHPGWLIGLNLDRGVADFSEIDNTAFKNNISLTQEKILHDLRKVAKKTRYNMELFTSFYDENYSKYLAEIKEIQEILGVIQDSFVLDNFLQKTLEKEYYKKMPKLHQMIRENRQKQLQKWQTKQKLFLDSSYKQNLRITIAKPL